jgi:hypothetical protein
VKSALQFFLLLFQLRDSADFVQLLAGTFRPEFGLLEPVAALSLLLGLVGQGKLDRQIR